MCSFQITEVLLDETEVEETIDKSIEDVATDPVSAMDRFATATRTALAQVSEIVFIGCFWSLLLRRKDLTDFWSVTMSSG